MPPDLEVEVLELESAVSNFDLQLTLAETFDEDGRPAGNRGRVHLRERPVRRVDGRRLRSISCSDPRCGDRITAHSGRRHRSRGRHRHDQRRVCTRNFPTRFTSRRCSSGSTVDEPQRTALIFGDRHLTYSDLDRRANRLARTVDRTRGRSGIPLSPWHCHARWNPWSRSGRLPGPAPHSYPSTRRTPSTAVHHMINDSGAGVVLTTAEHVGVVPDEADAVLLDQAETLATLAQFGDQRLEASELSGTVSSGESSPMSSTPPAPPAAQGCHGHAPGLVALRRTGT